MMWGLNKKSETNCVLISLTNSEVRMFFVENTNGNVNVLDANCAEYSTVEQLESACKPWVQSAKVKGLECHWLLSRHQYKTISVSPPKVPDSELAESIKWLVKDQIEQPLDSVLVSYYKPYVVEQELEKLVAVVLEREFAESIIEVTDRLNLALASIQINELAAGNALTSLENDEQITGLIDEDNIGLIFNFYVGRTLAFTRHIKGRFFPGQSNKAFSLDADDNDAQVDQFLLETQRTLDYCISQFFRKPVDKLALDARKVEDSKIIESLEQITELPVNLIRLSGGSDNLAQSESDKNPSLNLTISEAGAVINSQDKITQRVNFYLPQYQPKPLEFGFKFAMGLAAASVLGLSLYGYLNEKELTGRTKHLNEQNAALEKTQSTLQAVSKNLGKQNSLKNLDQELSKKQNELNVSRKLLARVETKSPNKPVIYSDVLAALSTQKAKSLWLTQINLSPTTINLAGQTTQPDSIPIYINDMSQNQVLASQFENLTIERDKQDPRFVHFQMTNGTYNNAH